MARKKGTTNQTSDAKVCSIRDKKTELQKLREENGTLRQQIAFLMKENYFLRKQANQPQEGPLVPGFIQKDTVEKLDDPDWYYRALDSQGVPMIMVKATGKWIRYSRANYIRYNGNIPDDYKVVPIDGNKQNFDLNNWIALPKDEFFERTGWSFEGNTDGKPQPECKYDLETGEIIVDNEGDC